MKKKILMNTALAGALVFSAGGASVFAHDELGGGAEKGDSLAGVELAVPLLEGSKNTGNLQEVAAVPLKEIREGVKNSTGDVYAHKGYAYLGTHSANGGGGGVRVFDMKDPSNPVEVAAFADIPGTWQEKVIVKTVNTEHFKGDLAAVSVQKLDRFNPNSKGGFVLYDVTNPREPKKLGFWEDASGARGTHELYLTVQGDNVYVLTANCYADYYSHGEKMDVTIVDVSKPSSPDTIYEFNPRDYIPEVSDDNYDGYNWTDEEGIKRTAFAHSVKTDGTGKTAFLSYWDLGTIMLDISDAKNPVYLGRTDFANDVQGAAHSMDLAKGGTVLVETREVFGPVREGFESAYGYTMIYDIKDKTNPKLLSTFRTDFTETIPGGATVHDPKVQGNTLYLSHYSGGVRTVDITDPSNPEEIGVYIPSRSNIWGVFVDRNYVLASDMGTGLKVLQKNGSQ
ncbi:LVIVD repeat-containing protein [Cytobacillus oceanisediminis]|uniref:LVIVD repeat-containing protein n=1 Tax=Cytobacillus oceanisediminis TaxID=665099 RepID=UPI003736B3F4